MKELTLQECKDIEFGILKHIDEVCKKNNLRYYLTYGTLIGAIRHKGFIPWDDDIDIFMPYEDYIKLIKIESSNEIYRIVSTDTNTLCTSTLPKIVDTRTKIIQDYGLIEKVELGLYVDIFLLNGTGDKKKLATENTKMLQDKLIGWVRANSTIRRTDGLIKKMLRYLRNIPYKLYGLNKYLNQIDEYRKSHPFYADIYVSQTSLPSSNSVDRNIWLYTDFDEGIDVEFERVKFIAPKEYDKLLTCFYGDYMKLPPEDKQITNHNYKAYWENPI